MSKTLKLKFKKRPERYISIVIESIDMVIYARSGNDRNEYIK